MESFPQIFNTLKGFTASLGFWWPIVLVPSWQEILFRASEYPALPWAGMNEARKKPFSARKLRPST